MLLNWNFNTLSLRRSKMDSLNEPINGNVVLMIVEQKARSLTGISSLRVFQPKQSGADPIRFLQKGKYFISALHGSAHPGNSWMQNLLPTVPGLYNPCSCRCAFKILARRMAYANADNLWSCKDVMHVDLLENLVSFLNTFHICPEHKNSQPVVMASPTNWCLLN